jgi:hypothetical protein
LTRRAGALSVGAAGTGFFFHDVHSPDVLNLLRRESCIFNTVAVAIGFLNHSDVEAGTLESGGDSIAGRIGGQQAACSRPLSGGEIPPVCHAE